MADQDVVAPELAAASYDGETTIDQPTALVAAKAAANLWVLKQQLAEDFITKWLM